MKKKLPGSKSRIEAGALVWLLWVAYQQPHPLEPVWARGLLLLAPLVVVPMGVDLLRRSGFFPVKFWPFW